MALRLAGDDAERRPHAAAAAWVRAHGGIEASRVFTRIWLAIVGQWDWEDLPVLPPEIMFLPPWAPLNIYDFGCWARQTIVALTVVMAHRPVRPLPFGIDELRAPGSPARRRRARPGRPRWPLRTTGGGSSPSTACCTATSGSPPGSSPAACSAGPPCGGPSSGSSRRQEADGLLGRHPTARSCTRSSPCTCRATRSTTR